jgi:streptogramin lyase
MVPAWRVVTAILVASLVAGCGGGSGDGSGAAPAPTASTAPATTAAPAALTAEPAGAVPSVSVADRGGKRLEIGGNPDYVAATADGLWVKTDGGDLVRIDPETTRPGKPLHVADALCQGLGTDDHTVWTCAGETGQVSRIDPAAGKVAATVEAAKINVQTRVPVAFGHAWFLVDDGSKVVGVANDAVAKRIELGTVCTDLAATATAIWAACPTEGLALRIDPASGEVTARTPGMPGANTLDAGEHVWVGFTNGLAKLDDTSGEVLGVADASPGNVGGIAVTPDAVWVRTDGQFLRHVDPATAKVVEDVTAPEQSGGSVVVAFGSVWATASDDDTLYRLDPA